MGSLKYSINVDALRLIIYENQVVNDVGMEP